MGRVSRMIKMFAILKRRDGMTHDEFVKYWLEVHAPIAKSMPGLRKYVCSVTLTRPGREPELDGVAELWFDDFDSMRKSWSSPAGQATTKDTENFAGKPTVIYASEHSIA